MNSETDAPETFRLAFEHSSIGHSLTAVNGRLLHVNQAMANMLGYTRDELMGLTVSKITHPDDLEASYERVRCLKAGEQENDRLEKRYLHRSGKVIWALVSTTLLRAADGQPLYFITDILDITEQKLANDKVKLLAAIVASSDDAIYSKNLKDLITHWNASAEKLYGYTAEEAIGQSVSILSPPGRSDEMLNLLEQIHRGETVKKFETRGMHKDGTAFDVALTVSPIYDDSGGIIGASAIARDITAHKRVAQNLIRSNQANRALSRCNEVMFRAENEESLFQEICEVVVKEAGYRLCWVGKAENDEARSVQVISQAGLAQEYLRTVNITWADTERGRGPAGTCIRTRKPVLTQNIARDPNMRPWQTAALKHNLASSLAIPLIPDGDVFGLLTIYAAEHNAFSDEEVRLLIDLANDLSFGIVTLRAKIEHKKARRALQKNQKLLNDSQRLAKIGAWEFDVATGHVLWSDEVYRIHGLIKTDNPSQPEQAIRFYAPEDQARISEAFGLAVEQGKPYDLELQLRTAQGQIIWVRTDGHAEFKDGKVIRVFGNIMDITGRKHAEEKLESSLNLLKSVLEHIPLRVFWKDTELRYLGCNTAFARDAGMTSPKDLLGKNDFEMGWREQAEQYRADDKALMASKTPKIGIEEPQTTPDGKSIWLRTSKVPLYKANQEVIGILGIYEDITERKQAYTALRESEVRYRSLFEGAGEGILIADYATMKTLQVNQAMSHMLGFTTEELLSFDLFAQVGEGKANEIESVFANLGQSDQPVKVEIPLLHKNGNLIYAQVTGARIVIDGQLCILGFFTDITQHKQADAERKQLLDQLNQAQKMEAIGRLAGGVAHDFNNMLSVIQGYAELTLMGVKEGERLFTPLKEIHDAAVRSAALTRQLLAFARKQPNHPRILNLNETVTGILSMLGRLIGKDIQLVWRPSDALMSVMLDPSQVDQILANLIVNARDAIQGVGEVVLETSNVILDESYCSTHTDTSPGDYVLLSVKDNGCGMSEELLAQIFEPFFTTKGKGIGTGLGLSTVYGIVKQNEGSISVDSEPGVGSTFNIHLPVALTSAQQEAEMIKRATVGGNETVLLVDDEAGILNMAKEVLIAYGYRVIALVSPKEALVTAAEYPQRIDLLLSDVIMPGMNGKELSQQLTAQRPELRTLYISGYTDNVLADGVAFLQKPFSVHALTTKVREVLDADR